MAMRKYKIFLYPSHEMILKCSFDYLMKEVRTDKLINIGMGKIVREQLWEKE